MRWNVLIAVILATTAAVPSAVNARTRSDRALRRAHIAVIGGRTAEPGTFPWMAYVLDIRGNGGGQCSGTVVAANLVLTAGHCAEDMQTGAPNEASGYQVVTGNVDSNAPRAQRQVSGVTRVIVCSCFDRRTDIGDVALLQLSTPTTAPAVTLTSSPRAGTKTILAGWGTTYYNQVGLQERLQWAPTVVQSTERCEHEAPPFSPASQICVMDTPSHQTGVCHGDSGGPLLMADRSAVGGMVQIGVADHIYGPCATTSPSVYTRADAISAWVKTWAQALASAPPLSVSLLSDYLAAPTLPGVASGRSLALEGNGVSLALSCDKEGGTCMGDVDATIRVRKVLVLRRGSTLNTSYGRVRKVRLTSVRFEISPGNSTTVHAPFSPEDRTVLSHLINGPLDVVLSGRGFSTNVVTLVPAQQAHVEVAPNR